LKKEKGDLTLLQIAQLINMQRSNYSRAETGERSLSIEAINKIARYFGVTISPLINFDGVIPEEIAVAHKTLLEQVRLIRSWSLKINDL
jgi:transcriptional regulator with XRE-family HTH domain